MRRVTVRGSTSTDFYPPIGQQQTQQLMHAMPGNPIAPDHTVALYAYPNRRNRSIVTPSNRPMWTTLYVNGGQRSMTPYQTPKGKVFVSPSAGVPQGQD